MTVMAIFFLRHSGHRRPDFDSIQLLTDSYMSFGRSPRLQHSGIKGLTNAKVDLGLRSLLQLRILRAEMAQVGLAEFTYTLNKDHSL